MERYLMIKQEPSWSQEIEEIVNIDNHLLIDEKPSNIKFEYDNNNTISSIPYTFTENYSAIKRELDSTYEEHPTHQVKNLDSEKSVNIDTLSLIDKKTNTVKLDNIDQNTSSTPNYSEKCFEIKQELDCSYEDHSIHNVDNASSVTDNSLSKLKNVAVILQRLSTVQILKYLKKSEKDSEYTYRLNVDAIKYVCTYSCSKCDRTVDTKNIRHIISRPECGCIPTLAYQCMRCDKHLSTYESIQRHVNTKGLCESRKRFLHMEGFNDHECEKLNCPKCNESLENIAQFVKHVNGCGEVSKCWCSLCDFGTKRIDILRLHLKLHARWSIEPKSGCSAEELTQNECNREKKKWFILKTYILYCSTCDETLVKKGFKVYSSTDCNKCGTPYTYRCPGCNAEYLTKLGIRLHTRRYCNTSKDYRCSVCNEKAFTSASKLKYHMSHCRKKRNLHCKFCPFKSKHNNSLYQHLKRCHGNNRRFIDQARGKGPLLHLSCEQCSEVKENGEYRNDCYYCLKCKTKLSLQCQNCNLVYKTYRGLTAHTSKCGLEIKDLTKYCAHCLYKTKVRPNLTRHIFRHHQNEF